MIWSLALSTPCLVLADSSLRIKPFFDLRYQYEDNVLQVPTERGEQRDFAAYIWAGVDVRAIPDPRTRIAVRYEMAPRRFADVTRKNRYDHLLSGPLAPQAFPRCHAPDRRQPRPAAPTQ